MIVRSVTLDFFRNYAHLEAAFDPGVNVIYGENAQGKTNLLEAVAYLSAARSHRARYDRELIQFGVDSAFVKVDLTAAQRELTLEAQLHRGARRQLYKNGVRLKTHIVSKVTDYERRQVLEDFSTAQKLDECGVSPVNLRIVQNDMYAVAHDEDGTAYGMFGDYKVKIAAKTGTAENAGSDHATFICYAPFDKPQVAIAVVIENGVQGTYSMQVAKDLLDAYFKS